MVSEDEGWVVGQREFGYGHSYILHYRNGAWQVEFDTGENGAGLRLLSVVSLGLGWAGGSCGYCSTATLLRWNGYCYASLGRENLEKNWLGLTGANDGNRSSPA